MTTKSEDVVGETWDYCIADSLIKTGNTSLLTSCQLLKSIEKYLNKYLILISL